MIKLTYEDYRDREYLIDKMIEAMYFLKEKNKACIPPDADEKRTEIFLNKSVDNYLKYARKSAQPSK